MSRCHVVSGLTSLRIASLRSADILMLYHPFLIPPPHEAPYAKEKGTYTTFLILFMIFTTAAVSSPKNLINNAASCGTTGCTADAGKKNTAEGLIPLLVLCHDLQFILPLSMDFQLPVYDCKSSSETHLSAAAVEPNRSGKIRPCQGSRRYREHSRSFTCGILLREHEKGLV